jgi:hypothetical protein
VGCGRGDGVGCGRGDGVGCGRGDGVGCGRGDGAGCGRGDGEGEGRGDGDGDGRDGGAAWAVSTVGPVLAGITPFFKALNVSMTLAGSMLANPLSARALIPASAANRIANATVFLFIFSGLRTSLVPESAPRLDSNWPKFNICVINGAS